MKVLVPVEGSKYSMEGIRVASNYAKTNNAGIYIMTVTPYVADVDLELSAVERDRLLESMKKRGEDVLEKAVKLLKSFGANYIRTILASSTSPAEEIVNFAGSEKIDLIVIGSKGMGATERFFLGSVTSKVVRYSPCCVYVVKDPCWV
ncbi:MAG: universal stress protein [Thermodesulfovibrionales bacterium]